MRYGVFLVFNLLLLSPVSVVLSQDSISVCPIVDDWQIVLMTREIEEKAGAYLSVFESFMSKELEKGKEMGKIKKIEFLRPNPPDRKPKYPLVIRVTYASKGNTNEEHRKYAEAEMKQVLSRFKSKKKKVYESLEIEMFSAYRIDVQ